MTRFLKQEPITIFFLAITTVVFMAMQLIYGPLATSSQAVYQFGGMLGLVVKVMPNQLWRLVTPIFIHIGWGHFFVNALTLYFVGRMAEEIWGSRRFLLLYVFSGIMGNAFTMWLTPDTVAAGASTSLFGLFAAIMVLGAFGNNQALRELGKSYQTLIVVNLLLNVFMPNVSMAGHVGGIIGGALLGFGLSNRLQKLTLGKSPKGLALLVYGLVLGAVLMLGFL
ncbi:UNVERIFIED_CONTAM: rhomboid family intramembrane serine protease [Streptococcus canis]|uniref:rhomboid family intramembrane serine protease n=1 Tax=Streptococcus canis TaxID=1329 RepID=UPI000B8B211C|nr:rhomboid family intramembrane serine protease [Streptococcus canis]MDV6000578.1 rhomboid family intramembrane serine protease [Streptococcus canis]MDV6022150.1 rhomboid family intramembrane serine protease [Streptococcus canis]QJD13096.1 rhomboid family intramembrane serine protease [Streptococcus canis]QKG76422.1 rhomboid family intramembrane serine protease [Streptococcus canis]VTR80774.1 integral membrane protein [Streptococcus canis]